MTLMRLSCSMSASAVLVAGLVLAGCHDGPTALSDPPPKFTSAFAVTISNPVTAPPAASGAVAPAVGVTASLASTEPVAYVSLLPGTVPGGTTATITNARTGTAVPALVVDGGFDPVTIPAAAGDTLTIGVVLGTGGMSLARSVVPASRPPRVVRTSPAKGRTDVAINASAAVLFSEPVDPATVNSTTFRLLKDGQAVSGTVRPLVGSTVGIEFLPEAPLSPASAYQLEVSDGIADLTGDRLEAAVIADFVTTGPLTPQLTGTLAFVSTRDGNAEIYTVSADGSDLRRLTSDPAEDTDPAWSPDGTRLAFTSTRDGTSNIYIMNADGSNVVRQTTTGDVNDSPAWSPDGLSIAFSSTRNGEYAVYVTRVDADWAAATRVGYPRGWNGHPAWSPDGSRILFVSDWRAYDAVFDLYVMNSDGSSISGLVQRPGGFPNVPLFVFRPAWSPDGRRIAMFTCADLFSSGTCYSSSGLAITNADGSGMQTLVSAGGWFPSPRPAWSADGSTIVYSTSSCPTCQASLRYITADGAAGGLVFPDGHSPSWRR
jgi:Tol biopolymer transport system component